jgi:hypothetical protein
MIVPGATPRERAIRLAGALAELGITQLILTKPDGARAQLTARHTDLPGILSALHDGSLECPGLCIRITRDSIQCEAIGSKLAEKLRAALAQ